MRWKLGICWIELTLPIDPSFWIEDARSMSCGFGPIETYGEPAVEERTLDRSPVFEAERIVGRVCIF